MNDDDAQHLWRNQAVEPLRPLSAAALREETLRFRRRIHRRNVIEVAAAAIVIPIFLAYEWFFPYWLTKVGALLVVVGVAVVLWQLRRRASTPRAPADFGRDAVHFHIQALVRQRDALQSVWLWYVGPLVPGFAVFVWGRAVENAGRIDVRWIWLVVIVAVALQVVIVLLNRAGARALQRRIDELQQLIDANSDTSSHHPQGE
jgi:hypothetical protein